MSLQNAAAHGFGAATAAGQAPLEIRRLSGHDMKNALVRGFEDFRACRTDVVSIVTIYPIAGLLFAAVVADRGFLPFVFPVCAGFALIGPLATLWFAALSRQRERAGTLSAGEAAGVFRSPRFALIQRLGGLTVLLFLVWNAVAALIYWQTLGSSTASADAWFLTRVFTTGAGWTMLILGCAVGAGFAVAALAIGCVSFPLALDRDVSMSEAIGTSLRAMLHNPLFVFGWGAVVVAGLILGAIPCLFGLVIVLPVLGHATWHIYRRMIV